MEPTRPRRRSRLLLASIILGLIPSTIVLAPIQAKASGGVVTNFTDASIDFPVGIATGSDGALWFTNYSNNSIGRITTAGVVSNYTDPSLHSPNNMTSATAGAGGDLWFTNSGSNSIGSITTSGTVANYTGTGISYPTGITEGPDGAMWFTNAGNNSIGRVTTAGVVSNYTGSGIDGPADITVGSDGALWFTNQDNNSIGRITVGGSVSNFTGSGIDWPNGIASGPDGALWFTNYSGNSIGRITTSGVVTHYTAGSIDAPLIIEPGPDGLMWFTNYAGGSGGTIGAITMSGAISSYSDASISGPAVITAGPDGAMWFTNTSNNSIGRITTGQSPLTGGALTAAQDPTGASPALKCGCGIGTATKWPINTESGNFFHTFTDFSIPGRSYPLELDRTYNSQNAGVDGPFGYGWSFNYGMSLAVSGTSPNEVATITQEDGSQVTFNQPASGDVWAPSAPRFIATLTWNSGSSTWTFERQGQDTYAFNSSGQLITITDLNGYTTTLTYSSGELSTVTDPAGRTLSFTWTGSRITSITDANVTPNRTVSYSYDGSGNLEDVTDVNGGDTHFTYSSHLMTVMKDPVCEALGGSCPGVQNHYNGSDQVDWQKDQLNRETTFSYSGSPQTASGGTTLITDPSGNEVEDGYQWGVRTYETTGYGTTDAATTYYEYDPSTLALTATMDPNGNVTTYTVDSSGNILTQTDPLGRVTTNTYNGFNELLTTEDGNGVTTTNTYDGDGNLTSTSTPLVGAAGTATNCASPVTAVAIAAVTCYAHSNGTYPGDVTSITDSDGNVTNFHYDSNGYQDEVKDPAGNVTATVRNNDGWTTATYTAKAGCTWGSSAPTGCSGSYETSYTQDDFGNTLTVTDPLSHVTTYTYDADQRELTVEDGNGNSTQNAYDLAGELCWTLPGGTSGNTCASPPTNARVTDYNSDGTVSDQKDGKGNAIITYGYNHRGQVTSTEDALSHTTDYVLDADGNVLNKIDPGGSCTGTPSKCTTYTYDADNELATVSYSDSSAEDVTSITYDSDGQRTAMTDGTGSSSWSYDSLHRLTSYTNGNGATVGYGYSGELKDQPITIAYPNSVGTVTQSWNTDGTLASVSDWNSKTISFGYDANDNLHTITDPSTTTVTDTYGYNDADQMTSVSDSNGSTLFSATYGRDDNGQVSSDSSQASNQADYKYTALNQLCYAGSSSTNACGSPPASSYPYAFDNADNLTTNNGATQQYNAADELCWTYAGSSANSCGSAPSGATSFNYDTKGNETSMVPSAGSATCYAYDQANRLTSVKTGTGSSCSSPTTVGTYGYDGDGLRESKTVSGTTTQFTWDGMGGNLLQQYDGTTKTSFIYGPGGLPVEQIAGSTTTYLHTDQLGSIRLITDAAGAAGTATTTTYDPYGNVVSTSGSLTSPLGYAGMYLDSESGLYYDNARYYDPTTAQFISVDPMVSTTLSPYAYVGGSNPINASDPSGLISYSDINNSQRNELMSSCASQGGAAGLCMEATLCPTEAQCAMTQTGFAAEAGALEQAASDTSDCHYEKQLLQQAHEVNKLAAVAGISADYYSGDVGRHLTAGIDDAGSGVAIGGAAGFGAGCLLTFWAGCAEGGAALGLAGGATGLGTGLVYGLATGRDGSIDEIFDVINNLAQQTG
jgi:RHS repeat-associated protein